MFKQPTNNLTLITNSLTGGEMSSQLFGRTDVARYFNSAALLRNFLVDYRGGALSRPGTRMIGVARRAKISLIPFQYSADLSYVLEFSDGGMRVIRNGAYVLNASKIITAVTKASPAVVTSAGHGFNTGNSVYISAVNGMTEINNQTFVVGAVTTNTFELYTQYGTPLNTTTFSAYTSGGVAGTVVTFATPWPEAVLDDLKYAQSKSVLTILHPSYPPYELVCGGDLSWSFNQISFGAVSSAPTNLQVTAGYATVSGVPNYEHSYVVTSVDRFGVESNASVPVEITAPNFTGGTYTTILCRWDIDPNAAFYNIYKALPSNVVAGVQAGAQYGYVGMAYGNQFTDSNIVADFTKTPPLNRNPFANKYIESVVITGGGSGYTKNSVVTISDVAGTGARLSSIATGGTLRGLVIDRAGENYFAPSLSISPGSGATYTITLGPASGNYPSVVAYFQQRRVFASTKNRPETIWASQPGATSNMDVHNPVLADDAYEFTLSSLKLNTIRALVPMPGGLVIGTDSGAWQLKSGNSGSAVTAVDASADPQGYNGFASLPPIVINQDIIFLQANGSTVRNLAYNYYDNIYTGEDLILYSSHLTLGYGVVDWAYSEDPYKNIFAVRDDGALLSMTFMRSEKINGWAQHLTQGYFKNVCSVQEGAYNAVYVAVSREINGAFYTFVERFDERNFFAIEDAWCVDCGLTRPLTYPQVGATVSGTSGVVTLTAGAPAFSNADVGKVVRFGGGKGVVSSYINSTNVQVALEVNITEVMLEAPGQPALPQAAGQWSMTMPVTVVTGLGHLEGKTVVALADGVPVSPRTVTNGQITLDIPATKVTVGLSFTPQLLTVPVDNGDKQTLQTKRKKVSSVTLRTTKSEKLSWGPDFNSLVEFQPQLVPGFSYPSAPNTIVDTRLSTDSGWNELGQIAVQQSYPLPANVIAIITELTVGDT